MKGISSLDFYLPTAGRIMSALENNVFILCFLSAFFFFFFKYSLHARRDDTLKLPFCTMRLLLGVFLPGFIVKLSYPDASFLE